MIIPHSTTLSPIQTRQVTSSAQMNEIHDGLLGDVLTLYNQANALTKEMNHIRYTLNTENLFLRHRLNTLESQLATLAGRILDDKNDEDIRTHTLYTGHFYTEKDGHEAFIDMESMSVTAKPIRRLSKVNVYDEGLNTTYIPPSLKLSYGAETSMVGRQIISVEDNGAENAFNGDIDSYWVRKYVCDPSCPAVYCELLITLPEDVMTSKNINAIRLNPYPTHALDILSIDYKENGNWITIPGFHSHKLSILDDFKELFDEETSETSSTIKNSPCLLFNFREIRANELRIRMRQENYFKTEDNHKVMYIGLKDVEVTQTTYAHDYSSFCADFELPNHNKQPILLETEVVLNNEGEATNTQVAYDYYYYDSLGYLHKIKEAAPFTCPSRKLHIKFKILNQSVTPNIRQVNVRYTYDEKN